MNKVWLLRSIAIVMIVLGIGLFLVKDRFTASDRTVAEVEPTSDGGDDSEFERCARGNNPILESYPRQCKWPNGTRVWEHG